MIIAFMFREKNMDSGIQWTRKETDLSPLSLKTRVFQQPVFTLRDGKKVSLNPNLIHQMWKENCD